MTTRRFPRAPGAPWRGRMGRFGLLGPFAISGPQCRGARALDRRRPNGGASARNRGPRAPARSRPDGGTCRRRVPAPRPAGRAGRRRRRSGSARASRPCGRSRRRSGSVRGPPLRGCVLALVRLEIATGVGDGRGRSELLDLGVARDLRRLLRRDLRHVAGVLDERELLMRRDAAVPRAGQRRVRAALAVGEDRRAAAGEVLLVAAAAEDGLGLGLRKLGVGLDVDLPAGQPRGEAGVQPLLADRQRELVVGDDDCRVAALVVDEDLTHARGRQRFGEEARRLGVERDDVDLLAAELGHDHADARAARADAGANRIDALRVRDDGDLRAIARLPRHAANLDETVGDLGHLELEQRLYQLRVAAREDHLRPLHVRPHLGDDGLDPAALLVALAVHLLGARQQRLDAAEVDEDVVAVARLLDDAGHDLAEAVDVLVVLHRALGLADALQDDLLGRLRRNPSEVVRGDVRALDHRGIDVRPVDVEVIVVDERVRALAVLGLEPLQLFDGALACLLDQPLLDVRGQLDREDAEVAAVVEVDRRVPRSTRRLLVRREQRVLERLDERAALDPLLALDLAERFDDLLAHVYPS